MVIPASAVVSGDRIRLTFKPADDGGQKNYVDCTIGQVTAVRGGGDIVLGLETRDDFPRNVPIVLTNGYFELVYGPADPVHTIELFHAPHPTNLTRFWTESGSEYEVDYGESVWRRAHNPKSPLVRTQNGIFWRVSPIAVGYAAQILCPPLAPDANVRVIQSTRVVRIEHL
jgi:hypothetical protein